jgi:hypothetical protein
MNARSLAYILASNVKPVVYMVVPSDIIL